MISKRLNDLFKKWIEAHLNEPQESTITTMKDFVYITKGSFAYDGVIDEEAYLKAPLKVLFVSSEANIDTHSAKDGVVISDNRDNYLDYYRSGIDGWSGKMRQRVSAIYAALTKQGTKDFHRFANQIAVMDINKRGGPAKINSVARLQAYVAYYNEFIVSEISIINPDVIVWIGFNTYRANLPEQLGAKNNGEAKWFEMNGKKIPVVPMWQTSYYQSRNKPLEGYENKTVGKLCAKAMEEYERVLKALQEF